MKRVHVVLLPAFTCEGRLEPAFVVGVCATPRLAHRLASHFASADVAPTMLIETTADMPTADALAESTIPAEVS